MIPDAHHDAARLHLAPGAWIATADLTFTACRSSGPGGQNVNKTESRVELRLPAAGITGLTDAMRRRLAGLAGSRLTAEGEIIIKSDETRSRRRNQDLAVERLRELVLAAQAVPRPRRATRPGRGAVERRLRTKAADATRKRERRPQAED